jgi:uncharacterized protein (TIGR02246 family)
VISKQALMCALLTAVTLGVLMVHEGLAQRPKAPAPPTSSKPAPAPARPAGDRGADVNAIRTVEDSFTKSYNAKDAKALGALFTDDAEIEDETGEATRGRAAIVERFTRVFAENQGGTLSVSADPIRFLGPGVAIEEGSATIALGGDEAPETTRYSVIYSKQDGRWLQARIRDEPESQAPLHERLKDLEWMLGEWINEDDDSIVLTSCKWSDDGNFLIRDFDVKIEGQIGLRGTQRIGWDSLQKQFRTWIFDSEGGFAEGLMSSNGDQWTVKVNGVRSDGRPVSTTSIITILGKDRLGWQAVDRTLGGVSVPDIDQFIVVRKPPQPGD